MHETKSRITSILLFVFLFCIPALPTISNIILVPLFILIIISQSPNWDFKHFIWFPFVIFILILSVQTWEDDKKFLFRIIPILLIPWISFYINKASQLVNIIKIVVLGVFFLQIITTYHFFEYFYDIDFNTNLLKNHSKVNEILNYERPYLGYFCLFSLVLIVQRLKTKRVFWLLAIVDVIFIVLISSKLAFIGLIITILFLLISIKVSKKKLVLLISAILILSSLLVFSTNLYQRFFYLKYDLRWVIWEESCNILQNNFNYLSGFKSQVMVDNALSAQYEQRKFEFTPLRRQFVYGNYNTHNQFLNELLRGGVIGLVMFIMPLFVSFLNFLNKKNYYKLNLIIVLALFFMVENLLHRQLGIYILSLNFLLFYVELNADE